MVGDELIITYVIVMNGVYKLIKQKVIDYLLLTISIMPDLNGVTHILTDIKELRDEIAGLRGCGQAECTIRI